ncbi:MAG: PD-(D/E)XK nuclease family protein [Bryobacteraceae bacterium]
MTPLDVAIRMGAPFLVERRLDPSEEGLGPALIMRLLLDLPMVGGYFRPVADQPTMAQALWSTIRELRMTGVRADDLKADAFEAPAKYREFRALLAAYEQFLVNTNRGDVGVVYAEGMKHLEWCPIQIQDCWTELPEAIWTPLQRRMIDAMPGERISPRALILPAAPIPRRLRDGVPGLQPDHHTERIAPDSATNPLGFLMEPPAKSGLSSQIALFHAGGREAEIEEVFRRILAMGVSLDQVEIASASDAHIALVWEKALRHEWPITLGPGIPALSTRPGRALIGFCDWIETDFAAAHLRHLLQSGDIGLEKDEGFTAGEAARTLARAEAGWGRATYGLALGALRKSYEVRASDHDLSDDDRAAAQSKSELTARVMKWIAKVIASLPEPNAAGAVPLQAVVAASIEYVEHSTARSSQLDHRAAGALTDSIGELRALGSFSCSLPGALRFIRERVQALQIAPDRPRPGSLYVSKFSHVAYSGRRHLFIVGLEEGRVFPSATEDAVLLDSERAAISPALRQSSDRVDEAVYQVLARLATCSGSSRVTFSYSVRDTREFRETYASWLMLQAYRLQQGDQARSYKQMHSALGEPVSCFPVDRNTAASESAWWLRSVAGTGESGIGAVETRFAPIAQGRTARVERESNRFTEYDGNVPEAGKVLDPCAATNAFSVTDLEAAASCPFRLFLKRGLGVRPADDRERDRDVWLDALTRGSELHDIYATALRRCRDGKRRPDQKSDDIWLRELAQDRLIALRREMPPSTLEIFERESIDFLADVALFLEGECEDSRSEPLGFEVSFGRPLRDEEETLARVEPVEIDLGEGLTFRIAGRIDRIDKVGPSSFEILDYKTGGYWRSDWIGTFQGGRRLQHALYGLAAAELLRSCYKNPKVTGGVYYFSSHKGGQERVRIAAPTPQDIVLVLRDLREVIVTGAFVHAPDDQDCKFCDFRAACNSDVNGQARSKLGDSKLKAFGRLAGHD